MSGQTTFISKLKSKYGADLAKSVERMAHQKLTKNVHEDMADVKSFADFNSDSLPIDLYELKTLQDSNSQLTNLHKSRNEDLRFFVDSQGTSTQRAKLATKFNFFLNKDFISELLDVDP